MCGEGVAHPAVVLLQATMNGSLLCIWLYDKDYPSYDAQQEISHASVLSMNTWEAVYTCHDLGYEG